MSFLKFVWDYWCTLLFFFFTGYVAISLYHDLGEQQDAFVVGWEHFVVWLLLVITFFILGWQSRGEIDK